jgi:hypothetical protein
VTLLSDGNRICDNQSSGGSRSQEQQQRQVGLTLGQVDGQAANIRQQVQHNCQIIG